MIINFEEYLEKKDVELSSSNVDGVKKVYYGQWVLQVLTAKKPSDLDQEDWQNIFKEGMDIYGSEDEVMSQIANCSLDLNLEFDNSVFNDEFFLRLNLTITHSSETVTHYYYHGRTLGYIVKSEESGYGVVIGGAEQNLKASYEECEKLLLEPIRNNHFQPF